MAALAMRRGEFRVVDPTVVQTLVQMEEQVVYRTMKQVEEQVVERVSKQWVNLSSHPQVAWKQHLKMR